MRRLVFYSLLPFLSVTLLSTGLLLGCAASSSVERSERDSSKGGMIPVYEASDLPDAAYEHVEEVTGAACKDNVYASPPSRAEALAALKRRAKRRGGNALINVACRRGKNTTDCSGALTCSGDAVRVVSVDALPRLARRSRSRQFGEGTEKIGTGWVVAPGLVVTSAQLVQGRSEFSVSVRDSTVSADLVASDELHDLALLRPSSSVPLPSPLRLAPGSGKTGERVFVVGYPSFHSEAEIRTSMGIISAQTGPLGDARVYRTTIPVPFEHGGAPLLNDQGQVVGSMIAPEQSGEFTFPRSARRNYSYAVKPKYIRRLRMRYATPDSLGSNAGDASVSRAATLPRLLEKVRASIVRVTAKRR